MPTTLPIRRPIAIQNNDRVAPGSEFFIWFASIWVVSMLLFGAIARWGLAPVVSDTFEVLSLF